MMKLLVTTDFCKEAKKLVSANKSNEVNSLKTALILLANNGPIPKKYSIDFVIDLNNYDLEYISELDQHLDKFSNIVKNAFE